MYSETQEPEMFALTSEELIAMLQVKEYSLLAACDIIEKAAAGATDKDEAAYLGERLKSTRDQASNVAYLRTHVIAGLTHSLTADQLALLRSRCSPVDTSKLSLKVSRFEGMTANAQYVPEAIGGRLW